jgi:hypothetical protein
MTAVTLSLSQPVKMLRAKRDLFRAQEENQAPKSNESSRADKKLTAFLELESAIRGLR